MQRRGIDRRVVVAGGLIALGGAAAAVVGVGAVQAEPAPAPRPVASRSRTPQPRSTPVRRAPVVDPVTYGADPTGARDSAPALRRALATLPASGGTVAFPAGRFRILATEDAPFLVLPPRAVVQGAGTTRTVLRLQSDDPGGYREFARPGGDDVVLQDLTLRRDGVFPAVLLNVAPVSGLVLARVVLDGAVAGRGGATCHGLQLAAQPGTIRGLRIVDSEIRRCTSCTLITNTATGRVRDVMISRTRLQNIDFNAPLADVAGIRVVECVVDNAGSDYFGIGLAHVRDVSVLRTTITGAAKEAVHIEDHSSGIRFTACRITDSARGAVDAYAYVQIVSGSRDVVLDRCVLDARDSTSRTSPNLVAVQPGGEGRTLGGRPVSAPTAIRISGCTLQTDGSAVDVGVYVESAGGVVVDGNRLIGDGVVRQGGWSGLAGQALLIAEGADVVVRGNTVRGWRSAVGGANGGGAVRFAGNDVIDCARLVGAGSSGRLDVVGNALARVLSR